MPLKGEAAVDAGLGGCGWEVPKAKLATERETLTTQLKEPRCCLLYLGGIVLQLGSFFHSNVAGGRDLGDKKQ